MGTTAILVGLLVAVLAATCWYAGEAGAAYVAVPTKIGTMLALLALAVLLGARDSASGTALLVGLALSLVGDIALTKDDLSSFAIGLLAFLAAHVAYVVAFLPLGFSAVGLILVGVVLAPFALRSFPRARRGAIRDVGPRLGHAMTAYVLVLLAMALAAGATGRPLLILGGLLFALSDTVLALDRFDAPRVRSHVVVLSLYHAAQAAIVLGVLR